MTPLASAAAFAQSLSDPIFIIDQEGLLAGANDSAADLLGSTKDMLTGQAFAAIADAPPQEIQHKLASWRRSRSAVPGTITIRTATGRSKLQCEGSAPALGDSDSARFILLRCWAERVLPDNERRFRAVFENASDAIIIANDAGMIVEANPAACELAGRTMDELTQLRVVDLSPVTIHGETQDRWRSFIENGTQRGFFTISRPDGEVREVEYNAVRDFIEGRHLSVLRDVTEQRRSVAELERQTEALANSNAELEQFAYVASHDLQEPLRTISSFLQLAERRLGTALDHETSVYMTTVRGAVHRLRRIILDLLEFSRLGRTERQRLPVDLGKIAAGVLDALEREVEEAGAAISIGQLPILVGDASQFHQLLLNLLGNALKFRSVNPFIAVTAERQGDEWVILIADNGPGIESRYFGRIFEPFRRLHGHEIPGSGIGLAISRRVVQNHGGRIWVESEPGIGSTFGIAFPVKPAPWIPNATASPSRNHTLPDCVKD